jgi:hypothetical protein
MKFFALVAMLAGRRNGGDIRCDRILPEPQPDENVRRHVQCVRETGSNLGIGPCGRHPLRREHRIVIGMDQVVRDSRMIRTRRKYRLEDGRRFSLIAIRLVFRRGRRHQRQCVEDRRFLILRISLMHSAHCISMRHGAGRVAALLPTIIENAQCFGVGFFARCPRL